MRPTSTSRGSLHLREEQSLPYPCMLASTEPDLQTRLALLCTSPSEEAAPRPAQASRHGHPGPWTAAPTARPAARRSQLVPRQGSAESPAQLPARGLLFFLTLDYKLKALT